MKSPLTSVRVKILLPALTVVVATLAALGAVAILSREPLNQLRAVQDKDVKALQLSEEMLASLDRLHLTYRLVAATGSQSELSDAKDLYDTMAERLKTEGSMLLTDQEASGLVAQFAAYNQAASADAARLAKTRPSDGSAPMLSLATEEKFAPLRRYFDGLAVNSRSTMDSAFEGVQSAQHRAGWTVGWTLLVSAVVSIGLAVLVAHRTATPLRQLREASLRIAAGDLTQTIRITTRDEVGELATSFERMVGRLRELVSALQSASDEMASAAGQLSEHTRAQAAMLEAQASGVAETSATTRELEQTSSMAASQAASVLKVAQRAVEVSEAGRGAAERSVGELHSIQGSVNGIVSQSSQLLEQVRQVSGIVATVRDLATQSHVLSLNASIEAARAGDAGKGFAVVAQEVRLLAAQSGEGAARIGKMVAGILGAVQRTREMTDAGGQGVALSLEQIRTSGESLRAIGDIVRETSDAALHIASAVQQQSQGIAQIAAAMHDLDKGMEGTVVRLRSLEQSAERIAHTATRISGVAAEFKL
jgi:methyl-accepting chemotaxis protein